MQYKQTNRAERGFTLVELLVVIGIIAALAAVVIPNVGRFAGQGDDEASKAERQTVQAAMDLYMADGPHDDVQVNDTPVGHDPDGDGSATSWAGTNPVLYPEYLRQEYTKCYYTWDTTGQVTRYDDGTNLCAEPPATP
ncbi:MAG: type II secretion system protein [Dehalococcoidia bacterium]